MRARPERRRATAVGRPSSSTAEIFSREAASALCRWWPEIAAAVRSSAAAVALKMLSPFIPVSSLLAAVFAGFEGGAPRRELHRAGSGRSRALRVPPPPAEQALLESRSQ